MMQVTGASSGVGEALALLLARSASRPKFCGSVFLSCFGICRAPDYPADYMTGVA